MNRPGYLCILEHNGKFLEFLKDDTLKLVLQATLRILDKSGKECVT